MHTWKVAYFSQAVVADILKWPKKILAKYLRTIELIEEFGPNLGPPQTKALGNGLYEIRVKAQEGIARAFYCYVLNKEIIILHGFIKKTQKIPDKELSLAKDRLKEVRS